MMVMSFLIVKKNPFISQYTTNRPRCSSQLLPLKRVNYWQPWLESPLAEQVKLFSVFLRGRSVKREREQKKESREEWVKHFHILAGSHTHVKQQKPDSFLPVPGFSAVISLECDAFKGATFRSCVTCAKWSLREGQTVFPHCCVLLVPFRSLSGLMLACKHARRGLQCPLKPESRDPVSLTAVKFTSWGISHRSCWLSGPLGFFLSLSPSLFLHTHKKHCGVCYY